MKEVKRIIRVDHAGELGAINIYRAQLSISRLLYRDMVPALEEMLAHENEHYCIFKTLLNKRSIRPCYAIGFWAVGGMVLGAVTGILGRNSIWVCTNAIESTVLDHLNWQSDYLQDYAREAYLAVKSIKSDEEQHQKEGARNGKKSLLYWPIFGVVQVSTKCAIWLSTKL
ncbi:demethoxyubiquinone hydroxylase family protein [Teredinibacter turnerae]|uniref:demethoxyubiquinone hydroxylase family protein n=1 Tax=Teredinibacter turnerae TaxID=2426 RepID=UPI0030D34622